MPNFLHRELSAAYSHSGRCGFALMKSWGIAPQNGLRVSGRLPGVDKVRLISGGLYERDPYGEIALIIPTNLIDDQPEDLVAIAANGRWARRTGHGHWLGELELYRRCIEAPKYIDTPSGYTWTDDPLNVFPDPLSLLLTGFDGCCPLDQFAYGDFLMVREGIQLVAPDLSFADQLHDRMMRPIRNLPEVRVAVSALEAAE
jgi:hypothetical protein